MKVWFLYQIISSVSGRQYFGIHSTNDITWASPRQPLTNITGYDPLVTSNSLPKQLLTEIERLGKQAFSIEALQGAPNRSEANRALRNALKSARSQQIPLYNRPKGGDHGIYIPSGRRWRKRIKATLKRLHHEQPRPRNARGHFIPGWHHTSRPGMLEASSNTGGGNAATAQSST